MRHQRRPSETRFFWVCRRDSHHRRFVNDEKPAPQNTPSLLWGGLGKSAHPENVALLMKDEWQCGCDQQAVNFRKFGQTSACSQSTLSKSYSWRAAASPNVDRDSTVPISTHLWPSDKRLYKRALEMIVPWMWGWAILSHNVSARPFKRVKKRCRVWRSFQDEMSGELQTTDESSLYSLHDHI